MIRWRRHAAERQLYDCYYAERAGEPIDPRQGRGRPDRAFRRRDGLCAAVSDSASHSLMSFGHMWGVS